MSEQQPITPISVIPSVNRLARRVTANDGAGNRIKDTLLGRDIVWEVVQVPADKVEQATMVWLGNEREQALLDPITLSDILATLDPAHGNDEFAKGRRVNGVIEVPNGSRRRMSCIIKKAPYNVLVCDDLTDEEMQHLAEVGNHYNPTSPWERGKRYARLVRQHGSLHKVEAYLQSRGENVSRRTISRCIKTAEIPLQIMHLFRNPSSLSADQGSQIAETLDAIVKGGMSLTEAIPQIEHDWLETEHPEDADEALVAFLRDWRPLLTTQAAPAAKPKGKAEKVAPVTHTWAKGKLTVAGSKLTLQLDVSMPQDERQELEQKIAALMLDYELPAALRGGHLTKEMYLEYQEKLGRVCVELEVAPSILEPLLLARFSEAMTEHGWSAASAGMLLNIRVMRATCQEIVNALRAEQ